MSNAFTQKPDLTKFFKEVKHAHHVSKLGSKVSANPTSEQRAAFFGVITPADGTNQSRPKGRKE